MEEKRRFHRVPFQCQTQVKCGDQTFVGELLDISMKGALILVRDQPEWPLGRTCYLDIKLESGDVHLHFESEMVHKQENHYGFRFLTEDIDTFAHLRRLLELNIGDTDEVDRELAEWMKG